MSSPFKGALGQYRKPRTVGIIRGATIEGRIEAVRSWITEDIEKLNDLSAHFGTQPGDYFALCIKLAEMVVPAFKENVTRGRPAKWTDEVIGVLIVEIERKVVKNKKAKGVAWAAKQLLLNPLWQAFIARREGDGTSADPAEVLRKKYADYKEAEGVDESRLMYSGLLARDQQSVWDGYVESIVRN